MNPSYNEHPSAASIGRGVFTSPSWGWAIGPRQADSFPIRAVGEPAPQAAGNNPGWIVAMFLAIPQCLFKRTVVGTALQRRANQVHSLKTQAGFS